MKITDPTGNSALSNTFPITMPTADGPPDGAYVQDVLNQGATDYWRLDQATGTTSNVDYAGDSPLTIGTGITGGVAGAVNDGNKAAAFGGTATGLAVTTTPIMAPNVFSQEVWFQTTTKLGGKLIGFGDKKTGNSTSDDRHIYMLTSDSSCSASTTTPHSRSPARGPTTTVSGTRLSAPSARTACRSTSTARSSASTRGPSSASRTTGTGGSAATTTWSGAQYFKGNLDDVSIYPSALSGAQVRRQYTDSGRSRVGGAAPADAYGASV